MSKNNIASPAPFSYEHLTFELYLYCGENLMVDFAGNLVQMHRQCYTGVMNALQTKSAVLHEIFSAIQGEGLLVGFRQILLRFHGCNLNCAYCDTPASKGEVPEFCRVEGDAGQREMGLMTNPLSAADILSVIQHLQLGFSHHSVTFTGGEPLLHGEILAALISPLQQQGLPVYLETNGTLWQQLAALPEVPQYIAMDIKLPSVSEDGACWEEHLRFLDTAWRFYQHPAAHIQIKIVFGEESLQDVAKAAALVAAVSADFPVILQPLSASAKSTQRAPEPETVLEAQRMVAQLLPNVRVIPQTQLILRQW